MEDNLEIYFCEICSESIPANELAAKDAKVVKGKVIGSCCLSEFRSVSVRGAAGPSPFGLAAVAAIVLGGIAAATLFLDTRMTRDVAGLESEIGKVRSTVTAQGGMWATLETRLDRTLQQDALSPVETRVGDLATTIDAVEERMAKRFEGLGLRFDVFEEQHKQLEVGQGSVRGDIKDVQIEVVRLGRELATAMATPRAVVGAVGVAPAGAPKPVPVSKAAEPGLALPPALASQIARLKDEDAGNRFEAVDQLVQSKNSAALQYLIPMLKDGDPFVRRLTAEGLASYKQASSVDALLVTLADPESIVRHTAHASLKKLTGQGITFDPDGSASARSSAQRRWKDWWAKNRGTF